VTDLIVFGEDWGAHPSSTQHLVAHLPGENRVVWVNSIGLRRPRLTWHDLGRVARKLGAAFRKPAPRAAAVPAPGTVVQPIVLPMAQSRICRALNRWMLARAVGGAARAAGLNRPVLWMSLPSAVDAVGALGERAVVYYAGDDFAALAGVDHARCAALEAELAVRADLILAASPAIAARFPAAKTRVLPHGVDLGLFGTPAARAADLPAGKVAGYYGTLASWLDYPMLAEVARLLPDWRFAFIGAVAPDVTAADLALLTGCPNVTLLGPRPHAALPAYAQHWTAGLIPFRDTAQIRASNPLKLREYLAAGRPVVATPFPALAPYRDHVAVATEAAGFVAALEASLCDDNVAAREALVAGESWAARAATAAALMAGLAK
jgi:glycosyltransferase involved in cell wall biosynthesis